MAKIRDDLDGVVRLLDGRILKAGDTVPDDVEVGEHVLAKAPAKSGRGAAAKADGDDAASS